MQVLIIGAGNMGTAYGASFISSNVVRREELCFLDRHPETKGALAGLSSRQPFTEAGEYIRAFDLLIFSVKPQDFAALSEALRPWVRPEQMALSIMAGVTMERIAESLGLRKIVRAMPNLPAQVGQGMTAFTATEAVSIREIFFIQNLLATTGKTLYVEREALLDAATALSGSGPAFVYYVMEAMMEAGRRMGFSEPETQLLVHQTFLGATDLLHRNTLSCQDWIRRVASKGGTTEAGLRVFEGQGLSELICEGLEAARQRAVELSR